MFSRSLLYFGMFFLALAAYAQAPQRPTQKPATRNPHGALNVPCENCHTSLSWKPIRSIPEFDHDKTGYPLRGMHEKVQCNQCHVKLVFANVGQKCSDCHADIHRGQLGANCESCHTIKGWKVSVAAIRDHQNRFPLIGAHAAVDCESCHKGAATGQFQGLSTQCYSCHATEYKGTVNPNHVATGFPTRCEQCHNTNSWSNAKFDHSSTGFPLRNAHADPPRVCQDCHTNNNFNLTTTACVSCHLKNFQAATNPNHVAGGFSQTCQQCHTTVAWQPAAFDHTTVGFPLTNAHADPPRVCADCHINNNYNITTTACASCHLKDYNTATTPINHIQVGFPTTCQLCHDTTLWTNGKFDHNTTTFPLTGFHTTVACANCHVNNNYTTLPTDCYGCHKANYDATTNPNHTSVGFPTTCATCHTTASWLGATFNHTWFRIPHHNAQCSDCHSNSANYQVFVCTVCHTKAQTDPKHSGVKNYVWNSTNCYQCHKQ